MIVIERKGAIESFGRSRKLVRDHGWQVFAVLVILLLLKLVLSAVVVAIAVAIADSVVGYAAADLVTNVLIAPLSALAAAVLYFELKRLHGEEPRRQAPPPPRRRSQRRAHGELARPARHTRPGAVAIVHQSDAGAGVFGDVARAAGHELIEWVPTGGGPPPLEQLGAAMVFGGAMDADQEDANPGLRGEKELLRELLAPGRARCWGAPRLAAPGGGRRRRAAGAQRDPRSAGRRSSSPARANPTRCRRRCRGDSRPSVAQLRGTAAGGCRGPRPQSGVPSGLPAGKRRPRLGASSSMPRWRVPRRDAWLDGWDNDEDAVAIGLDAEGLREEAAGSRLLERAGARDRAPVPGGGRRLAVRRVDRLAGTAC